MTISAVLVILSGVALTTFTLQAAQKKQELAKITDQTAQIAEVKDVEGVNEPIIEEQAPSSEIAQPEATVPEQTPTIQTEDPAPVPTDEQARADAKTRTDSNLTALRKGKEWDDNAGYGTWESALHWQWNCMERLIDTTIGFGDPNAVINRVDELKNVVFQGPQCKGIFFN